MPVNLKPAEGLLPVPGVRLGVAQAGVKRAGRDDLLVLEAAPGSTAAAVFTRNAFCAAPVIVTPNSTVRQMVSATRHVGSDIGSCGREMCV